MKKCLISGSFDPITNGHLYLVEKALAKFDKVVVGVFNNEEKKYLFDLEQRVNLCKIATNQYKNVDVISSSGMVSDYCIENNIDCIVRGYRNINDYRYETEMAKYNYEHCKLLTVLIPAEKQIIDVSSTDVRMKINSNDDSIKNFLPASVLAEIRRILNE